MKLKKRAHSVKRFSIEVDYPDEKSAKETQDKVLYLAKNKLAAILEDTCNRYGDKSFIKIKNITLDLGDIPLDQIENQLPRIFEKKIHEILSGFTSNIFTGKGISGVEVIDEEKQILLYFTYYLKYGTIPWYMDSTFSEYSFSEVFAYLIEKNSNDFRDEFFNLLEYSGARFRLQRFFDSGEIMQILSKSLSETSVKNISILHKELNKVISKSHGIESVHRNYLILYIKEFILIVSAKSRKTNQTLSIDILIREYIEFISKEKNISPIKWLPAIFADKQRILQSNMRVKDMLVAMQDYYANYLIEERSILFSSVQDKLSGKVQFNNWLFEKQPITGRVLSKAIDDIILHISSYFQSVQKSKIERIVWEVSSELIPDVLIAPDNVSKWIYTITQEVKEMFGVSLEQIQEESEIRIELKKNDRQSEFEKEISKSKEFNIAIIRDYLSLFIKGGLTPFKKLYKDPAKELKEIFLRFIEEEPGSDDFIKEMVEEKDVMLLWRVKDAFGDDFLQRFEKIIRHEQQDILPKNTEYEYLLFVGFIRTGDLPWVEIIEKGQESLIQIVEHFISPQNKPRVTQILVDEKFFHKPEIMEKVFGSISVESGKELLKIRKELVDKGVIDLIEKEIKEIKEAEVEEEIKGEKEKTGKAEKKVPVSKKESEKDIEIDQEDFRYISLIDGLVNKIIEFSKSKIPQIADKKIQANFIFNEIVKSARKSFYETAAMISSIDKKVIEKLLLVFDDMQKDYIKKLIRNYRTRFMNIAEEIKDSELQEEEIFIPDAESFFISNAGLVLLNVYLKRLFDRLELLENKKFKSDEAREKAVYILQYLVAKNDHPDEHELILNKIIVGMPISLPLKFDIQITDEEKEICDSLLDAIIKNWTVLKNTSRDGLRTSFLLRNGRLMKDESGWRLRVEKKTYDILLSKLQWGYSMIHFPWMEKPLLTDWEDQ